MNRAVPDIQPISRQDLFDALRTNVRQYADAKFSITSLKPSDIARLTDEVETFKLRRAASTLRNLKLCDWNEPLSIRGTPWGLFPPIVEENLSGIYTLIDGVHRLFLARKESTIAVVLVRNVAPPLTARATREPPRIVAGRSPRAKRYADYSGSNFPDIKKALDRGAWTAS